MEIGKDTGIPKDEMKGTEFTHYRHKTVRSLSVAQMKLVLPREISRKRYQSVRCRDRGII